MAQVLRRCPGQFSLDRVLMNRTPGQFDVGSACLQKSRGEFIIDKICLQRCPGQFSFGRGNTLKRTPGYFGLSYAYMDWFRRCPGYYNVKHPDYFPSMDSGKIAPNAYEKISSFVSRVKIECIDTKETFNLPNNLSTDRFIEYGISQPISWSMKLSNFDRKFTLPYGIYQDLITEEMYSRLRGTRKFITLSYLSKCKGQKEELIFPRLVIKSVNPVGKDLDVVGIDEISNILGKVQTQETAVAEENLTRINAKVYKSLVLINNYFNRFKASELYVNYQQKKDGEFYPYDRENRQITFVCDVDDHYPVTMRNPISAHKLIKLLCQRAVDNYYSENPGVKEYFPVMCFFQDFLIYGDISLQKIEPIRVILDILEAAGTEYYIMPVENRLCFVCFTTVTDDEYPASPDFYIPEELIRSEPEMPKTNFNKCNATQVIRPNTVRTALTRVVS